MTPGEITEKLGLGEMRNRRVCLYALSHLLSSRASALAHVLPHALSLCFFPKTQWYIQAACATQGDGLYEGLDWLSNELAK